VAASNTEHVLANRLDYTEDGFSGYHWNRDEPCLKLCCLTSKLASRQLTGLIHTSLQRGVLT